MPHIVVVDKAVGVTSKSVHMPIAFWNSTITHDDRHLVQRFREQCPKVPVVVGTSQIGLWITFYSVVQIRKLHRITEEKDRCIVSNQVPDAFIGIKFQGKTPDIP